MLDAQNRQAPYITIQAVDKSSGKAPSLHQRNPMEDSNEPPERLQKDWDTRLSFAMSAYRASRHESTGHAPNMLILGTEVRAPADIMYGCLIKSSNETYDDYVDSMRERMTTAYEKSEPLCGEPPSATRRTTTYEYEPNSTRKTSGYTTSILANLSDARTNGSESILALSLLSTHRHQSQYSSNDAREPRP